MNLQETESIYTDSVDSINDSESTQDHSNNKCHICQASSIFRSKKFCKFCNKMTCQKHSQKRRTKAGYDKPQRICVLCDEKIILQEIREEIDKDVENLGKEIMAEKVLKERNRKEYEEREEIITSLQESIIKQEQTIKEVEERNSIKLKNEIEKGEHIRSQIEMLRNSLDEHIKTEQSLITESNIKETQFQDVSEEEEQLRNTNVELLIEINQINATLKKSVLKINLEKTLCSNCLDEMSTNF